MADLALSTGPSVKDLTVVWAPETGLPNITKSANAKSGSSSGVLSKYKPQDVLATKNLVDGLYVPPLDQKQVRKLAQKNVKESAGKNWYNSNGKPALQCGVSFRFVSYYCNFLFVCSQVQFACPDTYTRTKARPPASKSTWLSYLDLF